MKELVAEIQRRFEALRDWVRSHPLLGEVYELIDGSIGDYVRDHGLMYAAAVAFYALLSLIPLVVLFASVAGFVLHAIAGASEGELDFLLEEVMTQISVAIPYLDPSFKHDVVRIVENRRGLGLVGLVAVLIAASQVFRALEFSFARIFARSSHERDIDPQPRNVVVSKLLFGGFVTALVSVFLVMRFVLAGLREVAESLPAFLQGWVGDPLEGDSLFTRVLGAMIIALGFTVVLRFFGGRRVRIRFAFLGGVAFCAMFIAGEWAYDVYLTRWGDFGALYGPFAAIMVVVLWIFFVSTLVLISGQLVKTVQRRVLHGPKWEKRWAGRTLRKARKSDIVDEEELEEEPEVIPSAT